MNNAIDDGQKNLDHLINGLSEEQALSLTDAEWDLFKDFIFVSPDQRKDQVKNLVNNAIDNGQKDLGNLINNLAEQKKISPELLIKNLLDK